MFGLDCPATTISSACSRFGCPVPRPPRAEGRSGVPFAAQKGLVDGACGGSVPAVATWVIGDIHGCIGALDDVLVQIPPSDQLVFLGDYIDRGPDPRAVVERLLRVRDRAVFVRGNHEDAMLAHFGRLDFARDHPELMGPDSHWLRANFGGESTLQSYGLKPADPWEALPGEHREFFEKLVFYYEASEFVAVHAGLRIGDSTDMSDQDVDDLMWIRWEWVSRESEWRGKHVYFGHFSSIQMFGRDRAQQPLYGSRSIGLDTGCGYGGFLSAWCHETGELVQVAEHRTRPPDPGTGR